MQIIFEAVVGEGFMSDIAVDEIKMNVRDDCSLLPVKGQQQIAGKFCNFFVLLMQNPSKTIT